MAAPSRTAAKTGTVTPLSSIFPAEEAEKAARHVQEKISQVQQEIDRLQGFYNDNTNLINLVQSLPDQLHHDIMVPFGKAAFFPGRLIHTNEFLVLLGEGYYADRTSKQTIEILKRRGKDLESQIQSFKAVMQDLQAEASFFENTLAEAVEGVVEIMEDYVDEASGDDMSKGGASRLTLPSSSADKVDDAEDEGYAHIWSRIDELEQEELEDENPSEGEEEKETGLAYHLIQPSLETEDHSKHEQLSVEKSLEVDINHDFSDRFKPEVSNLQSLPRDKPSQRKVPSSSGSRLTEKIAKPLEEKNKQVPPVSKNEPEGSNLQLLPKGKSSHREVSASTRSSFTEKLVKPPEVKDKQVEPASKNEVPVRIPDKGSSHGTKAFTGSIIERTFNVESNPRQQTSDPVSKPVSRFKQQRKQLREGGGSNM